jgi:3-methyladenine DNA glycosylase AlkC
MSSKNFIELKLDELEALKLAYIVRSLPAEQRQQHIDRIPPKYLTFIALVTFDKTENELKLKIHECYRQLINKCDDVELNEIKLLLK